ncbi:hypothetical protein Hanom_Chr16g01469641 [Helianthus anomalus]
MICEPSGVLPIIIFKRMEVRSDLDDRSSMIATSPNHSSLVRFGHKPIRSGYST